MKCDNLFVYCKTTCDPQGLYYSKSEVDEAIAQLKEKLHDVDNKWNEQCKEIAELKAKNRVLQSFYDLHGNVDNYIDQLKAKLESVQASAYADSVDAGMRERRLRRALWLLKTRYFWVLMVYASDLAKVANPSIIHKSSFLGNPTPRCMEEYQHEAELYDNARIKCVKKAEEYK